jgi:hypothetical protein
LHHAQPKPYRIQPQADRIAGIVDSGGRFPDIYSGSPTMSDPADTDDPVLRRRAMAGDESAPFRTAFETGVDR